MKSTSTDQLDGRFGFLLEKMPVGVIHLSPTGLVLNANPAAEKLLGLTQDQMRGRALQEFPWQATHADGSAFSMEEYPQAIALKTGKPVRDVVMRLVGPASDSRRWLRVSAEPFPKLKTKKSFEILVTFEEVQKNNGQLTAGNKRPFDTLITLKEFLDFAPDAMIVSNAGGRILLANPQAEELFGYTQAELMEMGIEDMVPHSARHRHSGHRAKYLQDSQTSNPKVGREVNAARKDGSEFPIEIHFSTHTLGGETLVLSTIHDITKRKQAETAIKNNQQLLQESQAIAKLQSWTADFKKGIVTVKQRPAPDFGMPPGEYRLDDMAAIIHPDDREFVLSMWGLAAENVPLDIEYRILINHEIKWIHVKTQVLPDEQGNPAATLGFTQEVTKRRQAEELTHTQRDLARMISTVTKEEDAWPQCLEALLRISGMDSGGIYLIDSVRDSLELVYHEGLGEKFIQSVSHYSMSAPNAQMVLAGMKFFFSEEEVLQSEEQKEEGLRSLAIIPIIDHGRVLGCVNIGSHRLPKVPETSRNALEMIAAEIGHIIVHMHTEARLHANEEQYRSLINSQDSAISTIDEDGVFHYMNQIGAAPFGGDPNAIIGKKISDLFPPQVADWQMEQVRRVISSGQGVVKENQITVAGQPRWRRVSIQPIFEASGQAHLAMVNSFDITDQKNAEASLSKSETLLAEAQRIGRIGHWEWSLETQSLIWSEEVYRIFGVDPAKFAPSVELFENAIHPEDRTYFLEQREKMLAEKQYANIDHRILLPDGQVRYVQERTQLNLGDDGRVLRVIGTVQDITERKLVENALAASEKKLRSMIESQTHFLLRINMEGRYTYWNPKFEQEFGWIHAGQGLQNASALDTILPHHHERTLEVVQKCLAQPGTVFSVEIDKPARDGGARATLWEFTCITDENNQPSEIQCMGIEITERKRAEAAQRESESKYRLLAENISDVIWILDLETSRFLYVSPSILQLRGYTVEEVMQQDFLQTLAPASLERVAEVTPIRLEEAQRGVVKNYVDEVEQTCKDGSTVWTETTTRLLVAPETRRIEVYGVSRNITERKKAEAAMRQIEKRNTALIEHAPDGIALVDVNGDFTFISPSACRMFGYQTDELLGTPSRAKVHPDDLHLIDGLREILRVDPGQPVTRDYRFQHKDGSYRWIESTYTNMFSEPSVGGIVINFNDITERTLAGNALRRSEERFHSLFENSPIAIWEEDFSLVRAEFDRLRLAGVTDFRKFWREHPAEFNALSGMVQILEVNHASLAMLGAESKDQMILNLTSYFFEDSMPIFEDEMVALAEGQTCFQGEIPVRNVRGERITLDLRLNVQPGHEETLSRVLVSFQDITERKRTEEVNRQQSEQIRLLYEASQKLNRSLDLMDIYQTICDFMSVIAPNDTMFISAYDAQTQLITCRAYWLSRKWLDVSDIPAIPLEEEGRGTQSRVIRSGQALLINDFQEYMRATRTTYIIDSETEAVSEEDVPDEEVTRSALVVPLKSGGAVTGVLQVASYKADSYNENQLKLLESLALHVASAEQNALLYAQAQNELRERKTAEEALRRSEALLTEAQRIGRIGHMAWSAPGSNLVCSEEVYRILELPAETVLTQDTIATMMTAEERDLLHQKDHEAFSQRADLDYEYQVRLASGRVRWLHQTGKVTYGEDGKPVRMMAIIQDITERKLIEGALYDSETRAQAMLKAVPDLMFRLNREGVFLDYKADIHDLYAQSEPTLIGLRNRDITPPEFAGLVDQNIEAALSSGHLQTFEYLLHVPGKGPQYFEARMTPSGRNEVTTIVRNITERKHAEEALRETQSRVLLALKGANAGMWDWKVQTGEAVFNDRWAEMIGYTLAELEPISIQTWADLCHPDDLKTSNELLKKHFAGETDFYECEARMKHKDGGWVWVIDRGSVMEWDADGSPLRMFGTHLDITERKQAEEDIRQRSEDLALINALNDAANRGETTQAITQLFMREMRRLFGGQEMAFFLLSPDGRYLELFSTTVSQKLLHQVEKITGTSIPRIRIPLNEDNFIHGLLSNPQGLMFDSPQEIQKWVVEFTKTIFHSKIAHSAIQKVAPQIYKMLKIRSVINMPLTSSGSTIGLMDISSREHFTEADRERIHNIVQQMTAVILRKQAEENVQTQLRRITALSEIDRAISSSLDLHLSLEVLLSEVVSQLRVDAAAILLLNPNSQMLEYSAGKGFRSTAIRQSRLKLGEGLPGHVGISRKTLHVSDLSQSEVKVSRVSLFREEGVVEYFGVPLVVKGMLKGVLEILHRSRLELNEEWENYLETLGGQAAIAIDNAQLFEGMQQSNQDLVTAYDATIAGWSRAMDLRDKETEGHTQRVTEITVRLAERMGIPSSEMVHIRRGALLHDIGKLGVPDNILLKPGKLTDEEWKIMREHPKFAFEMLLPITYLRPALDIPYSHHERWDGTGYPRGMKGEQIPLAARVFAIVDVWDALRSDRPYRKSWPTKKVRDYLLEQSGSHFDPQVAKAFIELMDNFPDLF